MFIRWTNTLYSSVCVCTTSSNRIKFVLVPLLTLPDARVAEKRQVARRALRARRRDRTRESGRASPRVRRASRATWESAAPAVAAAGVRGRALRARRARRRDARPTGSLRALGRQRSRQSSAQSPTSAAPGFWCRNALRIRPEPAAKLASEADCSV